jgi:hypothetical protein
MPTKSSGLLMIFKSSSVNFGASLPRCLQIGFGVAAFEHHGEKRRVLLARRCLSGLDVLGGFDQRDGSLDVLGRADLDAWRALRANRLHRKPVR